MTTARILLAALALTFGVAVPANAGEPETSLETRIHALGCDVGAAKGYGDRVVMLKDGTVLRWSIWKLADEKMAGRFFWMVGNCPIERSV